MAKVSSISSPAAAAEPYQPLAAATKETAPAPAAAPVADPADAPETPRAGKSSTAATPGKLPTPPGKKISAEQFFKYISRLSEEHDWPHCVVYVYRQWPVLTDPADSTEPKYIDKLSRPFDAAYMEQEHGSGTYHLMLNDQNTPGAQRTVCRVVNWAIRNDDRPPVIPDLKKVSLSDPANRDYVASLIRRGLLTPQGQIPQPPPAAGADANLTATLRETLQALVQAQLSQKPAKDNSPDAVERSMAMMQRAHEKSMELVAKTNDPAGALSMLSAIKELIGPAQQQASPLALMKEMLAALREMAPPPPAPAPSMAGQLKELMEAAQVFREMSGGPPERVGKTSWAEVAMNSISMLPGVLAQAATIFYAGRQAQPQMGGPRPMGTGPHVVDATPPALTAGAQPAQGSPAAGAPPPPELANDPSVQQLAGFLPAIGQPLANALNQGQSGAAFAQWIAEGFGEMALGSIQQLRAEQIRAAIEITPTLGGMARQLPAGVLDQFIDEFLHGDAAEPEAAGAPEAIQ